jgi:hypothetical protein
MWKYVVGFFAFAGLALWVMSNSGPVDLGGEHAAQESMNKGAEEHGATPAVPPAPTTTVAPVEAGKPSK